MFGVWRWDGFLCDYFFVGLSGGTRSPTSSASTPSWVMLVCDSSLKVATNYQIWNIYLCWEAELSYENTNQSFSDMDKPKWQTQKASSRTPLFKHFKET